MLLIPTAARTAPSPRYWLVLTLLLLAIKLVLILADPTQRFFLGDSESYLHSALTGWIPPDRSFLYGLFIRHTAIAAGSLAGLLLAQTLCGILTALLCARLAVADLGVDRRAAALLALLIAIEPAQLFYERMVMAESLGTLCLIAMLSCGFAYLRRGWWPWLLAMALAGIATVALRMSLLPVVLGFSVLPPLAAAVERGAQRSWRRVAAHLAIAVTATVLVHQGYQRLYGYMSEGPPTYLQSTGTFRLGLVAPLVKPAHLQRVGLDPALLQQVGPVLADPREREAQLWLDDGLVSVLRRAAGPDTERLARKIAARALSDDPLGLLRLALATTADYFVASETAPRMADDLGTRPLSDGMRTSLRERLGYVAATDATRLNPAAVYFEQSGPWLIVCLFALAPLALVAALRLGRPRRSAALLLVLTMLGLVAGQLLFSHIVSFRYLHPFPPLLLLCAAAVLAPARRRNGLQIG
ncbi:glycosyltransferase family 39 protein [Tahibacter caeni]|uniref:glycosyltransferase family 39 protein n=1 Tax=Tahibacter caeni TaxID=1453545 RepID=UPI0021486FD9|nr:glycosyltransferase family 39 protein [Tahibacter caeni]